MFYQDKGKHKVGGVLLASQGRRYLGAPRAKIAITSEAKISQTKSKEANKEKKVNRGLRQELAQQQALTAAGGWGWLPEPNSRRAHIVCGATRSAL